MAQNRNLFRLTRFIVLKLPSLFRFFSKFKTPEKRILIIKTDAIGDYMLFRNFIEVVKNAPLYAGYEIDLLANPQCKDVAVKYDAGFINQFFFTRTDDLDYQPAKTLNLGWRLFKKNYHIILHPTYSRTLINDGLVGLAAARHAISFMGNTERITEKYKLKTDKFYTQRFALPTDIYFEFDRSVFFFANVLGREVKLPGPSITYHKSNTKGIIIFPGAGVVKRSWPAENFLELIKLVRAQTAQTIYLAGGPAEIAIGSYLEQNLPPQTVINLINTTSLPALIDLIGNATLVISNETSAIHIASATQTKTVCILGGGHFGRFAPYPHHIAFKPLCVYYKMDCYYCNWNCKFITANNEPYPCVSNVAVQNVWQAVQPLL
ncbi:MAG: glycosyltransferase family 9 protein [Mucilaginibacter sp.]